MVQRFRKILRTDILLNDSKQSSVLDHPGKQNFLGNLHPVFFRLLAACGLLRTLHRLCHSFSHRRLCHQFLQALNCGPICTRNRFNIIVPLQFILKADQTPCSLLEKCSLSFRRIHIILFLQHLQSEHKSVSRISDPAFKFLSAQILDKFIRILIWIHPDHLCSDPGLLQDRNCPKRRSRPCLIAVIGQIYFLNIPLDQCRMPGRQCSSQ